MKPFLTHRQQLRLLRSRGLIVPKDGRPLRILEKNNYYYLINGYKDVFQVPNQLDLYNGTSIYDFYALCEFDRALRLAFFVRLMKIESQIKAVIAYHFSKSHGPFGYLDPNSFERFETKAAYDHKARLERISKWISSAYSIIAKQYGRKAYIAHYCDHHINIPLWVLINTFCFGDLSSFYDLLLLTTQTNISNQFNMSPIEFSQYVNHLRVIRNTCAHDERLFSIKTGKAITPSSVHSNLGLPMKNNKYTMGLNDLFASYISVINFLETNEIREFNREIKQLFKILRTSSNVSLQIIMSHMGFPRNWDNAMRYI